MLPSVAAGPSRSPTPGPRIAVLGAGISGLCMAVRLKEAGLDAFTVFEKAPDLGGTWRENVYPGAACDVPSHLYSFSFAPNPDFSRKYSPQPEIQRYLRAVAERHGVLPHLGLNREVTSARFDDEARRWTLGFRGGESLTTDVVITGLGQLNRPSVPDFEGLSSFRGVTMHSARFESGAALDGARVAVVGSGASAVQIVPELARRAARLHVYQRTPNWIVPRGDRAYSARERATFRRAPGVLEAYRAALYLASEARFLALGEHERVRALAGRLARVHLEAQVPEGPLRRRLTPDYPVGCKRVLLSDDYYPALQRAGVELVTERIRRFEPEGIRDASGRLTPLDVVIFATGFDTTSFLAPLDVRGRRGERLEDTWAAGAEAYLGVTVPGFPNLFMLYGPNTNLGHNSIIFMIECQVAYVVECLRRMRREGLATVEVRREVTRSYNATLQAELSRTVWATGCDSWYKTKDGKITNNWSRSTAAYWWKTRRPDWSAFSVERG